LQGVQLRGFRDGIAGASKEFGNNQHSKVKDRGDYRIPHLQADQKEPYSDGFQRGYEWAMSHLVGGPDQPVTRLEQPILQPARTGTEVAQGMRPELPPGQASGIQRRGFQDGIARARKDSGSHRRMDVADRDESRRLKLSPDSRLEYLASFTQGYDQFMSLQASAPQTGH
jgi:ribosome modulation factor